MRHLLLKCPVCFCAIAAGLTPSMVLYTTKKQSKPKHALNGVISEVSEGPEMWGGVAAQAGPPQPKIQNKRFNFL